MRQGPAVKCRLPLRLASSNPLASAPGAPGVQGYTSSSGLYVLLAREVFSKKKKKDFSLFF